MEKPRVQLIDEEMKFCCEISFEPMKDPVLTPCG